MRIERKHLFPVIWLVFIIYASLTPSNDLPKLLFFPYFDKFIHLGIYFVFSILLIPSILSNKQYFKSYFLSGIISILTGILFEFLQYYLGNGRTASPMDALANSLGTIVGILFYMFFIKAKKIEKIVFKIE